MNAKTLTKIAASVAIAFAATASVAAPAGSPVQNVVAAVVNASNPANLFGEWMLTEGGASLPLYGGERVVIDKLEADGASVLGRGNRLGQADAEVLLYNRAVDGKWWMLLESSSTHFRLYEFSQVSADRIEGVYWVFSSKGPAGDGIEFSGVRKPAGAANKALWNFVAAADDKLDAKIAARDREDAETQRTVAASNPGRAFNMHEIGVLDHLIGKTSTGNATGPSCNAEIYQNVSNGCGGDVFIAGNCRAAVDGTPFRAPEWRGPEGLQPLMFSLSARVMLKPNLGTMPIRHTVQVRTFDVNTNVASAWSSVDFEQAVCGTGK